MASHPDTLFSAFWDVMASVRTTTFFRFAFIGLVILLFYFRHELINSTISENPDVIATKAQAQADSVLALQANEKADRLITTQDKIFAALKAQTVATTDVNLSLKGVSTQVDLLAKQMDRIEGRQDGYFDHAPMTSPK